MNATRSKARISRHLVALSLLVLASCTPESAPSASDPPQTGSSTPSPSSAPSPGSAFALWPEDTPRAAGQSCREKEHHRSAPEEVARAFATAKLSWTEASAAPVEDTTLDLFSVTREPGGPSVEVYVAEVRPGCWSVLGVSRPSDEKPTGVSVSVRDRRAVIGFEPSGAASAVVEIGWGGRNLVERWDGRGVVRFRLPFAPDDPGHFLILLEDGSGRVFEATGGTLPAGEFSAG